MSALIAALTEEARLTVSHMRTAAGEAWQDDSGRDLDWLEAEAAAILARQKARGAYEQWKRKHRFTWRWRTYGA